MHAGRLGLAKKLRDCPGATHMATKTPWIPSFSCLLSLALASVSAAQSALDGTSFQVSTYNLPDSVGVVRLTNVGDSNCRVSGGPEGNDVPAPEACLVEDAGTDPVTVTFGAGPQAVGGLLVDPTVTPFLGLEEPVSVANSASELVVPTSTWATPGDLIEFALRTADDTFPSDNEDDFWGFAATGIQYPNADPDSEVGLPFDEELGNNVNFYFWYEDKDGPITAGYDVFLPVGLGVGRHPIDEDREVLYPLYSRDQADDQTDTVAGGTLDFYSHGSILDPNPPVGNILFLADNTVDTDIVDPLTITGFGLAVLVTPPELVIAPGVAGDFDGDAMLTAMDIDALSEQVNSGGGNPEFDLNQDGSVDDADRQVWITDLAGSLAGDADLDGSVAFADFLLLSASFGTAGGWGSGDFDGSGDVQFADFLLLSATFGQSAPSGTAAVPEPGTSILAMFAGPCALLLRQRRRGRS